VRKTIKGAVGMPVGVQVASTPYNEEKVLYLMKQL
jgi:Asp-tRNA(Asn)/Glu-tRNA(Gln) amidotransferase A subunit family amidase